jgi:hypothetical protein
MDLIEIEFKDGIVFRISKLLNVKYTTRAVIERLKVNKIISKEGIENIVVVE